MLFKKITILLSAALAFASCEKHTDGLSFPETPFIKLISVSDTSIVQFKDQLTLTLYYEDGDGDLGTSDPDINSIFVQDNRLTQPDEYYLGPLAPEDAVISIQGTLELRLSPTFLLGNGPQETAVFTVYVADRAGNQSNIVQTVPITILRE